jgi:hypothetical protein
MFVSGSLWDGSPQREGGEEGPGDVSTHDGLWQGKTLPDSGHATCK